MLRIYLTSQIRIENGAVLTHERELPGRQGRLALAYLVAERSRPLSRDEIAEELWPGELPVAWEKGLMAIISKLRAVLRRAGLPDDALRTAFGCYQLALPADTWVDIEVAAAAVHDAEVLIAAGTPLQAYPWAEIGYHIGRRPFLPGEDGPWVTRTRMRLRELNLRALDCCVECLLANGEIAEAVQAAEDALKIEPIRETTYQRLMRVHAATGNRAEALRSFERCRSVLGDELGVPPSPETMAIFQQIVSS